MNLLITGHPRSGTWLMHRLCDYHPDIRVTYELGLYRTLNVPTPLYALGILGRMWETRSRPVLSDDEGPRGWPKWFKNNGLKLRFLAGMLRRAPVLVQPDDIGAVLGTLFPEARMVGDKYPNAVFNLGAYAHRGDALKTVVIYRDGRDVVASYLNLLAKGFDEEPVFGALRSPGEIAQSWVAAIGAMRQHAGGVHAVRYEALIRSPEEVLPGLGAWLGVDPAGFRRDLIRRGSIGAHRERLSPEQLAEVERIAGPTLRSLGYDAA